MRRAVLALALTAATNAYAHEVRPAYLELVEQSGGEFEVLLKTPMQGDWRLSLWPTFSVVTVDVTAIVTRRTDGAAVQTWRMRVLGPLRGEVVRIAGLEGTMTDALVRAEFVDGTVWTERLTPAVPAAIVPLRESAFAVARVYLVLGVEHILLGIDHLLFVLALLLVTQGGWQLVQTVSAFTVSHSLTLGLATLDVVHVAGAPVEATIALSIAFVAAEVLRARKGHRGLASRLPWVVAFAFGLLHGFGFAGALGESGLPQTQVPLALLCFNLGVESGQLLFIAVVLGFSAAVRWIRAQRPGWGEQSVAYCIGSVATFWVIQRVAAF